MKGRQKTSHGAGKQRLVSSLWQSPQQEKQSGEHSMDTLCMTTHREVEDRGTGDCDERLSRHQTPWFLDCKTGACVTGMSVWIVYLCRL